MVHHAVDEILVLGPDGVNLGKMPYGEANTLAEETYNLGLVQVNKNKDELSVYKIMDYGKWKYEQNRNKHNKQHSHKVKEISFRVSIDIRDMERKINNIKDFISRGSDVRISVVMRKREKSHPERASDKLNYILGQLGDSVVAQKGAGSSGSVMAVIRPSRSK